MGPRARITIAIAVAGAGFIASPTSARAQRLLVTGGVGHTAAIIADVRTGGPAFEVGLLGAIAGPWHAGVTVRFDDMGDEIGRLSDPNDGVDLGSSQDVHVGAVGWSARLDGRFHGSHLPGTAILTGTTGVYNAGVDRLGESWGSAQAWGWSLGGSWLFPVRRHFDVGPAVRYHRVLSDRVLGRYVTLGLDWGWR